MNGGHARAYERRLQRVALGRVPLYRLRPGEFCDSDRETKNLFFFFYFLCITLSSTARCVRCDSWKEKQKLIREARPAGEPRPSLALPSQLAQAYRVSTYLGLSTYLRISLIY